MLFSPRSSNKSSHTLFSHINPKGNKTTHVHKCIAIAVKLFVSKVNISFFICILLFCIILVPQVQGIFVYVVILARFSLSAADSSHLLTRPSRSATHADTVPTGLAQSSLCMQLFGIVALKMASAKNEGWPFTAPTVICLWISSQVGCGESRLSDSSVHLNHIYTDMTL